MDRCKTCRHWDTDHRDDSWGYCRRTEMDCDSTNPRRALDPSSIAVAKDGSGYWGVLVTAPAFGCVQWEAGTFKPTPV